MVEAIPLHDMPFSKSSHVDSRVYVQKSYGLRHDTREVHILTVR